jgi:KipI family sensor histidine kinase inhibitor
MQARPVGEHALLVECADAGEVAATYALVRSRAEVLGAAEIVPAARTVLLDGLRDVDAARALLGPLAVEPADPTSADGPVVDLPVTYDGADLDEVARQWDVDRREVVRIHTAATFVVAFCGFSPGFAYCIGLPDRLSVRRRDEPRPVVPAGSVALAGEFTGVYPGASPGGWQLIGRTDVALWRPSYDRPALLAPGTTVRFVDA